MREVPVRRRAQWVGALAAAVLLLGALGTLQPQSGTGSWRDITVTEG